MDKRKDKYEVLSRIQLRTPIIACSPKIAAQALPLMPRGPVMRM